MKEIVMDWNRAEGNWKQVAGKVKEKWGKLTDDDLTTINGRRDQLEGKIQERYGLAKDQVKKDVDDWYGKQSWYPCREVSFWPGILPGFLLGPGGSLSAVRPERIVLGIAFRPCIAFRPYCDSRLGWRTHSYNARLQF